MSEKLQRKEFPPLTESREDTIILNCWNGQYKTVKDLLVEFLDNKEDLATETNQ